MALSQRKGFRPENFANLHPGGRLGKKLMRVEALMHSGDLVPRVAPVTGNPTDTQAVNGGHYAVNAWVLGLGGRYRWD